MSGIEQGNELSYADEKIFEAEEQERDVHQCLQYFHTANIDVMVGEQDGAGYADIAAASAAQLRSDFHFQLRH